MKKVISILLALVMALSLCACAKTEEPGTTGGNAGTTGSNAGTTQTPATTKTVLCLTKIVASYEGEECIYNVTYKEDGIHVTPEKLVDAYDTVYDASGKVLSELRYNDEGINTDRITCTYNNAGLLTGKLYWDVEDDSLAEQYTCTYNDHGQLVKTEYDNHGIITHGREYAYDSNGYLTTEYYYGDKGVLRERYEYTTNSEGQIQSCKGYRLMTSDEPLSEWGLYTYSYDSAGRLLSKVWENTTNYPMSKISEYYTYDQNGNVTSSTDTSTTDYTYNENGYLVSLVYEGGSTNTFVYAELELTEAQAEMAQKWSKDGVKNAFVDTLDD